MNESWIKLYRKVLESWVWKDKTAWRVFSWLLLVVDKRSGTFRVGRYQGAKATGLKPFTFRAAIKRLEREKIITLSITPRYTVINITNFGRYQGLKIKKVSELSTSYPHRDNTFDNTKQEIEITTKVRDFKKEFFGEHKIKNENLHNLPN